MERRSPESDMVKISVAKSPVARSYMVKSPMMRSPMPKSPVPRSPVAYEKYKSRCAYGLISLFRFRHRQSKKMISDTYSGSFNRHSKDDRPWHSNLYICDAEHEKTGAVDSRKAKLKKTKSSLSDSRKAKLKKTKSSLSVEKQKKITSAKVENAQSDSEHSHDPSSKNRKAAKISRRAQRLPVYGCYDVSTTQQANSTLQNVAERTSNPLPQCKKDCKSKSKEINLQVNLNEATEALINQKLINGRHISNDGSINESKHFLDALEVLNSNKDLFVKLLQDPNSLLVKHIEDLRESQEKDHQKPLKHDGDFQSLDNIVILKPNLNSRQHCSSTSSPESPRFPNMQQGVKPAIFPFEQMKRKLMQAMRARRKKQQQMSTSSIDAKVKKSDPSVRDEACFDRERNLENSCLSPRRSPKTQKDDFYIDPRIDISELRSKSLQKKQKAKSLDGISFVPDYDLLPMMSPGRAKEDGFVSPKRTFPSYGFHHISSENHSRNQKDSCFSPRQNTEASPSAVHEKQYEKTPDVENMSISSSSTSTSETETNISEDSEQMSPSGMASESGISHNNGVNLSNEIVDTCEEIQPSASQRTDSSMETQLNLSVDDFTSSPSNRHCFKEFDIINDNTEQPSPISVLDQFFTEDTVSPINSKSQPMSELLIGSEEVDLTTHQTEVTAKNDPVNSTEELGFILNYISRTLQASNITWDELSQKCRNVGEADGLSLIEDIHLGTTECFRDQKLLFDYINEVVLDAYTCYSRCSPWLSFIKPSIVSAIVTDGNIVDEIMKYVDPELLVTQDLESMEKIIGKDLIKSRWMDIRLDAEDEVCEIIDDLLDDLTSEFVASEMNVRSCGLETDSLMNSW